MIDEPNELTQTDTGKKERTRVGRPPADLLTMMAGMFPAGDNGR